MDLDPNWKRAGGTDAGAYYEVEPGILLARPNDGYQQSHEGALRSLEEMDRIIRDRGRKHALIVLVDQVTSQDAGSRRVWRTADPGLRCGLALVCASALSRAIGSFFLGLHRPLIPTRMFRDFDAALDWSRERVAKDGGSLEE